MSVKQQLMPFVDRCLRHSSDKGVIFALEADLDAGCFQGQEAEFVLLNDSQDRGGEHGNGHPFAAGRRWSDADC